MPPKKKTQKISLNEFLGDTTLGSWADEMETLPNAPAMRADDVRTHDRYGRKEDFSSSRLDKGPVPPREDLPLPTNPPYTAFVGNLAFDLSEIDLEDYFGSTKTKAVKIIKDRDDKPKGFGYIEFVDLDGLKDALTKSGSSFAGRTIRVSVAEPPKERIGFGAYDTDNKFDNPWRRDGPLPDFQDARDPRRRFDVPPGDRSSTFSEDPSDWRSSRPLRPSEFDVPQNKRKGTTFLTPENQMGTTDKDDMWTIGSKFKPSPATADEASGLKIGSLRGRGEMRPPKDPSSVAEENDWRNSARAKPAPRDGTSPSNSTPSTPQLNRRKLELLPRSASASTSPSPLSSPKLSATSNSRSNPFGSAKPVDVTSREKEVADRLEKERETLKERSAHPISRTSSRTASERALISRTPPPPAVSSRPTSPKLKSASLSANVRPTLSFANVASAKTENLCQDGAHEKTGALHITTVTIG